MHRSVLAVILAASAVSSAHADFITPNSATDGWDRGVTPNSLYGQWDAFVSPFGPNLPDVGSFVGGTLPEEFLPFNVFDANEASGSFIVSSGNIYSFSGLVAPQIELPGFGLGDDYITTILVQFRTLGSEFDSTSALLNNTIQPVETVELLREEVGGQFGGALVDTLLRFEVEGNLDGYTINFIAGASSMSLDRVAVDAFTQQAAGGCNSADLAEPFGVLDLSDINTFVTAFSGNDLLADLNGDEVLDLADIGLFVGDFTGGCP